MVATRLSCVMSLVSLSDSSGLYRTIDVQMNLEEISRIVEFGEADPFADFYQGAPADFAARWGLRVEKVGSASAFILAGADITLFNRVLGLGIAEPATEEMVDRIASLYKEAGVRGMVQLAPTARPAELPRWLEARGLTLRDNWVKMIRGLEPPPPVSTNLRVERIGLEHAQDHARIACEVYRMPPEVQPWLVAGMGRPGWSHYLAFDGDTPVATGALCVMNHIGWLGIGATLPSHRNRGAQSAIFTRRILDGAAMGCKWLITETWEERPPDRLNPSYHNMLRMGFEKVYVRGNYLPMFS